MVNSYKVSLRVSYRGNIARLSLIGSIMQAYKSTILVSSIGSFDKIKPGQWVQIETGSRGQYLGTTDTGAAVIRWQSKGKFAKRDAVNNMHLRNFAKTYGSK